jgi:hypothetical protein
MAKTKRTAFEKFPEYLFIIAPTQNTIHFFDKKEELLLQGSRIIALKDPLEPE